MLLFASVSKFFLKNYLPFVPDSLSAQCFIFTLLVLQAGITVLFMHHINAINLLMLIQAKHSSFFIGSLAYLSYCWRILLTLWIYFMIYHSFNWFLILVIKSPGIEHSWTFLTKLLLLTRMYFWLLVHLSLVMFRWAEVLPFGMDVFWEVRWNILPPSMFVILKFHFTSPFEISIIGLQDTDFWTTLIIWVKCW